MSYVNNQYSKKSVEQDGYTPKDFEHIANELCEKALIDAKEHLHPLIRSVDLDRLDRRSEFVQAFKQALEQRIAKKLAAWHSSCLHVRRIANRKW